MTPRGVLFSGYMGHGVGWEVHGKEGMRIRRKSANPTGCEGSFG
jgi:hypothetical protein